MSLPIKIPVKPYVYKVLTSADFFGDPAVTLSQTDAFGNIVYRSMSVVSHEYTQSEVEIPEWFLNPDHHRVITIRPKFKVPDTSYNEYNLFTLSVLFEELVRNAFLMFMSGRLDKFPAEIESIRRFREIYDISEEEFKTEAFKKQVQRFRWRAAKRAKKRI